MFGKIFNPKKPEDEQGSQVPVQAIQGSDQGQNQQYTAAPVANTQSGDPQQSQQQFDTYQAAAPQSSQVQQPNTGEQQGQQVDSGQSVPQSNTSGQAAQDTMQNQTQSPVSATNSNNSVKGTEMSALSHLDPRATQVLTHAQEEAHRIHQQYIEPDQLLFGLLYDEEIYKLLEEFQVDGGKMSKAIQANEKMGIFKGQPILSKSSQQAFDQAYRDAKMRGSNFVSPDDLLIVLFSPNFSTSGTLQAQGLKKENVVEKVSKDPNSSYGKKTVLEKYGIDLTAEAREGHLDPVAGRDKEMDRVIHILLRRTKNNPIIIGETGVGKTAIVEGLAQKIVAGQVPKDLLDKRIFQLDVASLVAGASHRGEFEERMRAVINEVLGASNKIILFIDEIHALMGTGEGEGMNAANIIKPHLARGHFQLIGATTTTEYRKNFEKDKAFERRFQPVTAEEPSDENAVEMLKVLRPKYEKFHHVTIPDDTLVECVKLAKKYIGERWLPDKAVDLLDEGCSEVKLQGDAGKRGDSQVKKADVEKVVSAWTGIPITKLTEDESEKLLKLEDRIHKRLIDQEEAVVAVSEAVRRGRIGLASGTRPIASFVFLGPTGVGKTELAKTLAELLFGRDDSMARLDMSEFMEKHEVAKLIGAPPGYVGYEEGGVLTEAVRKKPYSIVLLDEIEKAHPDVFNILLQLLEDGRLTDNKGNVISFKNTIVICTSNIGSSLIQQQLSMQDPKAKKTPEEYAKSYKQLSAIVKEELIKFFRPELLNRFDEVVIFKPLQPEHMAGIARLGIAKTAGLLKEQGFNLQITEKAIAKLAKDGYDPAYGARPLRRMIQTSIENPIALAIISKKFVAGDTIVIDLNEDLNEFIFTKGGQVKAKTPLNDEQFKLILLKIVAPETITDESEKNMYMSLREKVVKASTGGNKTASSILSVNAMTSQAEIQTIRKELEDGKNQGDEFAKEILDLADRITQQIAATNGIKKILLEIVNPVSISSVEKKEIFSGIHSRIAVEAPSNPLAASILALTADTPPNAIDKIMNDLNIAMNQGNELAGDILRVVNTEVAEEMEKAQKASPATKFKNILQQVINPLYAATPENKEKFSKLYDKIEAANQQNYPLAGSILAISDMSSDSDIEKLIDQLRTARDQGDQLAGEILDNLEYSIKYQDIGKIKNTALLVINPLVAKTPKEREDFTALHDKLTQASQKNNQLATMILGVSQTSSKDDILAIKQALESAMEQKDEIASIFLDAATNVDGSDFQDNSSGVVPQSQNTSQPPVLPQANVQPAQPVQSMQQANIQPAQPLQQIPMQQNAIPNQVAPAQSGMPIGQPMPYPAASQSQPVQNSVAGGYPMSQSAYNYNAPAQNTAQQVVEPVSPGPVLQQPFQPQSFNPPMPGAVANEFNPNMPGAGYSAAINLKAENE